MITTITNTQTVERMNAHTDRRNQPAPLIRSALPSSLREGSRTYASATYSAPKPHADG
jgi:hypothetical protein